MPLIVTNAQDALTYYDVLDQAEPDALDFEIAGNLGSNYVVSGGGVTTNNSSSTVNVAAASVVVQGRVFTVAANSTLALPAAPINKRFDLVIARLSGTTVSLVVVKGPDSSTNPTFPVSRSVTTAAFDGTQMYDPGTDVVLGAVYRPGSGVVTRNRILDKRALNTTVVSVQSASAPTATPGTSQAGVLNYQTGTPSGSKTGLFVGDQNGNWTECAANVPGSFIPIGGMIQWPSRGAVPANYIEPLGQSLNTGTYAALFVLWGYDYGGAATTFFAPTYSDGVLRGTAQTVANQVDSPGSTAGSDTITLSSGQLPTHAHDLQNHTHTLVHTHGIDHDHPAGNTGSTSNDHTHSGTTLTESPGHQHYAESTHTYYSVTQKIGGPGTGPYGGFSLLAGNTVDIQNGVTTDFETSTHGHGFTSGGTSANHTHVFDPAVYSGPTISQSASVTSTPSTNTTGNAGAGSSVTIVQKVRYVRNIIRAF